MKFCLIFLAAVALVTVETSLTEEQKETLRKNNKECVEETGVDEEKVKQLRKGDFSDDDENLQRYVFCMFRKSDLITEDGKFKKDVAMSKVPEDAEDRDAIEKAIDACMDKQGGSPHESAWMMAKCYHEENPNHSFL